MLPAVLSLLIVGLAHGGPTDYDVEGGLSFAEITTGDKAAEVAGNHVFVLKNAEFTVECRGAPQVAWIFTKEFDKGDGTVNRQSTGSMVEIKPMTFEDSGNWTCYDQQHPESRKNATLIVHASDRQQWAHEANIEDPANKETLLLNCPVLSAASSKKPENIKWFKNGVEMTFSNVAVAHPNNTLEITKPAPFDTGIYTCNRYSPEGKIAGNSFHKVVGYAQAAKFDRASQNVMEGTTVKLACKVFGHPIPTVSWVRLNPETNESEPIRADENHRQLGKRFQFGTAHGVRGALLIIKETVVEDSASYVCEARNRLNMEPSRSIVILRVKSKLAALWPFVAICLEVIILCTIIFIYERRRSRKQRQEDADLDVKKGLTSEDTVDVKQRTVKT